MNTVCIYGDLKNRMDAMIDWELQGRTTISSFDDRWMINDLEHSLPAPRTSEDFTGDVWGSYIETMAALSRITGTRYPEVDRIVRKVMEYQQSDGSFWNAVPEDKDVPLVVADNHTWGWQRALIGLVEYYRTFQDERVLQSAQRLGDFLLRLYDKSRTVPPDTSLARTMRGSSLYPPSSYWSAVIQGFVRLYQITREEKYFTAAVEIADRVPDQVLDVENTTDWLTWHGVMLLYEETGERKYLEKVKKNVRSVMNMMTALGDTPHLWHFPKSNEACGLADSITLNCDLWRTTFDPEYLDAAERIAYNAFFASQYPRTGCGRYNYEHRVMQARHADPSEETGIQNAFVNVFKAGVESSCDWHVPIAFRDIAGHIFWKGKSPDIYVNLFFPSRIEFSAKKTAVRLEMETDYPHDGSVRLKIETDSPAQFPLHIRIPYWAEKASVTINADPPLLAPAGKYLTLDRVWNRDTLCLELPLSIRMEAADPPWSRKPENPEDRVVLLKGPMVMVLDKDNNPDLMKIWNEPYVSGIRPSLAIPENVILPVPEKETSSSGIRSFRYPKSHYAGIWEIFPSRMQVKGHLTPFMEVTGEENPSYVQYVFQVKSVSPDHYREYAALAGDDSFRHNESYRQFLRKLESPSERTTLLTDFLAGEKDSYDAVLAAHWLGDTTDPRALDALAECLKVNSVLMQCTAVLSIRRLGLMDEKVERALNELAEKVPELRSLIEQTLTQLGSVFHIGKEKVKNLSWIDGPDEAGEYLIRKTFDIRCPEIAKADLRICSWDIYEVFWNETITGVKPTWANAKFIDLTPLARPGINELRVRVIRRGKLPDEFIKTWSVGYATIPPGIIMKLTVNYLNGDQEIFYTDESWESMAGEKPIWMPVLACIHKGGNPFAYGYAGD